VKSQSWALPLLVAFSAAPGCDPGDLAPGLAKDQQRRPRALATGQYFPQLSEAEVVGGLTRRVTRGSPDFSRLVKNDNPAILFKDEERTGADRLMQPLMRARMNLLAQLVRREWPGLTLRVTEAWDENGEHGDVSVHYAGRAADVTTSDMELARLGRLAGLAIEAGFDWVYREKTHVHVSVRR
jgi:hypothetical protein